MMGMRKVILILAVLFLVACDNNEIQYDGKLLNIAVIGELPELENDKIHFKQLSLEQFKEDTFNVAKKFDAIMVTPELFEPASDDTYVNSYQTSEMPIIFFNSNKRHLPFVRDGLTYETADFDALDNGSHTTIYLYNMIEEKDDAWFFYLDNQKNINELYREMFQKVEAL
ncbi:amino acid oxidase [Psychrobacillus sp. FSL H8-0487]|uniref:amino acid oxidase n=1 Tax=Psychrobacillus sp. FSL H8-0487 TaxID=2921391 RepID=UPI0030F5949E